MQISYEVKTHSFLIYAIECVAQVENWMAQKLQLATEESYRDPANIQAKHQKHHQAFEAE